MRCFQEFFSGHACFLFCQSRDDSDIGFRLFEQRGIQVIEFMFQWSVFGKKDTVDILWKAEAFFEKTPVERNTAHDHIAFKDLMPVHDDIPGLNISLAFFEGEWLQVYSAGETIIQPAFVMDDFVQHPGCYRAADDQKDIFSCGSPAVPEAFKRHDKVAAAGIHP